MIDKDPIEERLGALLRGPGQAADLVFVGRLTRRVEAERRLEAARKTTWSRFMLEASATAALLTAFILLAQVAPDMAGGATGPTAPALAAALLLGLWFAVELRPASAGR